MDIGDWLKDVAVRYSPAAAKVLGDRIKTLTAERDVLGRKIEASEEALRFHVEAGLELGKQNAKLLRLLEGCAAAYHGSAGHEGYFRDCTGYHSCEDAKAAISEAKGEK